MRGKLMVFAAAIVFSSCQVAKPGKLPPIKHLPDTFDGKTDTASIANLYWREFFQDAKLIQLIDTALINNTDLLIALERINTAHGQLAISKAALLPRVDAVAGVAFDRYGDYTLNGVGNFDTNLSPNLKEDQKIPTGITPDYFVGFRSNWEIDLWGKLKARKKAAIAQLLATEQGRHLAVTQVVAEVARLYYDLLALDEELEIVNKNLELQKQAVDVVKIQKESGRATELAVQQFSSQLMNTKAIAFSIRSEIVQTENQLNLVLGSYPKHVSRDTSIMKQSLPLFSDTGTPAQLLIRRPDIAQAEYQLQASRANVKVAQAQFLPSLNLSPYIGFNAFKSGLLFNPASLVYGVVSGLAAPVINQRELRGGLEISNAQAREAIYNYQQKLLQGYSEVVTNIKNIENTRSMFQIKQQEVDELSKAVATAHELYLGGYANYLEIITAQKGVLEAELQLTQIKKLLFHQTIDLYRALGGGWGEY